MLLIKLYEHKNYSPTLITPNKKENIYSHLCPIGGDLSSQNFLQSFFPRFGPIAFLVTFLCLCPKDTNVLVCFYEFLLFRVEQAIAAFINTV